MPRIPTRNFLPSTGTLVHLRLPEEDAHVRVDTGVRQGDTVTPFYDPDDRQGDRARPRPHLGDAPHGGADGRDRGGRRHDQRRAPEGAVLASGLRRRRGRYRLHRAPSRHAVRQAGAGRRSRARRRPPWRGCWNSSRPRRLERSVGPEERLPAARRGPRRGALEGRRARGGRDRPPPARRRHRPGAAGRRARGARAAPRRRPAGDPAGRRHFHGDRGAPRRRRTASTTRCSPTARSRTPAAGRSARRHAVRGRGLGRGERCGRRCRARSSTCA